MARARWRSCKYRISAPALPPTAGLAAGGCGRSFLAASRTDRPRANVGAAAAAAVFVAGLALEVLEDCCDGGVNCLIVIAAVAGVATGAGG